MEIKVLEYTGNTREGSDGFYVDFSSYTIPQDHWTTVGRIAQKYGILKDNTDLESGANWESLFSKLKHVDFGIVYLSGHLFPEFENITGLLKFVKLLNNGLKEPNPNFINLNYIV